MYYSNSTLLGVVIGIIDNIFIYSKHLTPIYDELAKTVSENPNIIIAKVDATAHKLPGVEIRGYPTLKFFKKGG
jgi:hypothetical protein